MSIDPPIYQVHLVPMCWAPDMCNTYLVPLWGLWSIGDSRYYADVTKITIWQQWTKMLWKRSPGSSEDASKGSLFPSRGRCGVLGACVLICRPPKESRGKWSGGGEWGGGMGEADSRWKDLKMTWSWVWKAINIFREQNQWVVGREWKGKGQRGSWNCRWGQEHMESFTSC